MVARQRKLPEGAAATMSVALCAAASSTDYEHGCSHRICHDDDGDDFGSEPKPAPDSNDREEREPEVKEGHAESRAGGDFPPEGHFRNAPLPAHQRNGKKNKIGKRITDQSHVQHDLKRLLLIHTGKSHKC